jgi:3-methylcrotonyl-CoA carboxylase beta subunit
MGSDQAANTLLEVKARQMQRNGEDLDAEVLERVRSETRAAYEHQLTAYFATSKIWDDGLLDPVDTRNALGMAITASLNAPLGDTGYGVFRF